MLTTRHSKRPRRRGTVLLEFMMIMPLFLFLCLFSLDMGRMIVVSGAMNDASYVSARAGAQRGDAGTSSSGPSRSAFDRAIQSMPGAGSTSATGFTVVQGRCTSANSYIVVEASRGVSFITPGLGQLLGTFERNGGPDTSAWTLRSRGAVLCEIVR